MAPSHLTFFWAHFVRVLFAAVLICVATASPQAQATPVTFRFEAEVGSVTLINGGSDLLPEVVIGDSLRTVFAFEDSVPGLNHPQSSPIQILLTGITYEASEYSITVRDQFDDWVPFLGSLANPESTPVDDRGPGGVSDTLWIGSVAGSSGVFDTILSGESGSIDWQASILFAGDENTINENLVPVDPSVWNSMIFKEMSLLFTDAETSQSTRVGVFITNVISVPEPLSLHLGWLAVSALCSIRIVRKVVVHIS